MQLQPRDTGWIEVICGSMFSGKTEELIRRCRLARIAKQSVVIFKPRLDDRFHERQIVSHSDQRMESYPIVLAGEILDRIDEKVNVVGVDEAQFFGSELVEVCEELANRGLRVIVAGLDQDYQGRPFEPIPSLLAVAEFVTKNLAICVKCGNPANRSQRIGSSRQRVLVGAQDKYEARCRHCFTPEPIEESEQDGDA
ncbi:MAG TPA: thymidine kinase [Myxococcota bacterium]|nr:thymidine kinase [Myxococcota bacterium]